MSFRKYQSVENGEILSPQEHGVVADELRKVGKSSMSELNEDERKDVSDALAESD